MEGTPCLKPCCSVHSQPSREWGFDCAMWIEDMHKMMMLTNSESDGLTEEVRRCCFWVLSLPQSHQIHGHPIWPEWRTFHPRLIPCPGPSHPPDCPPPSTSCGLGSTRVYPHRLTKRGRRVLTICIGYLTGYLVLEAGQGPPLFELPRRLSVFPSSLVFAFP